MMSKLGMVALGAAAAYGLRGGGRRALSPEEDKSLLAGGTVRFFRGGYRPLQPGPAYFTTDENLAASYGPVKEYRIRLRNPKFVSQSDWLGQFDRVMLGLDPEPLYRAMMDGNDAIVLPQTNIKGERQYVVLAISGDLVSEEVKGARGRRDPLARTAVYQDRDGRWIARVGRGKATATWEFASKAAAEKFVRKWKGHRG